MKWWCPPLHCTACTLLPELQLTAVDIPIGVRVAGACSGHININTTQSPPHPQSQHQPAVIGVMFSSNQQPADNLDILTVSRTWPILPPMFLIGSSPLQLLRCGGIFKINGMVTLMYWLILAQQLGSWAKKATLARGFCVFRGRK